VRIDVVVLTGLLLPNENKIIHCWRGERGLQWTCVHNVKRGSTMVSGCCIVWLAELLSSHGRLLGLDPSGLMICAAISLSLSTKRANRLRHIHRLASVLVTQSRRVCPRARVRCPSQVCQSLGGSASRRHTPYQMGKSKPATPPPVVGTSGSKGERARYFTPSATSVPSRMWGRQEKWAPNSK